MIPSDSAASFHDYLRSDELGFSLDISQMHISSDHINTMAAAIDRASRAMALIESGHIANLDEGRMVGHYWLRAPSLAPGPAIRDAIVAMRSQVTTFSRQIREGITQGAGGRFTDIVHIGIGGSALGPRILSSVHNQSNGIRLHVIDNADPDTLALLLSQLVGRLGQTLVLMVSKSGTTPTPYKILNTIMAAYDDAGLNFARHAVAITIADTPLDKQAAEQQWLARVPLWDWVGGRTSITAAPAILPIAIIGGDIEGFLNGAAAMDELTRTADPSDNPAVLMALAWDWARNAQGKRNMAVLPYRDRLYELPQYVQQLIMESIGKRLDRDGQVVHQGLTVYGNRGEPDQHSFLQQLRDGADDAFVTFIGVHTAGEVHPGTPAQFSEQPLADHLFANLLGTREALSERHRLSLSILLDRLTLTSLGGLIALFERATGIYAELVNINAYHQPGVKTDAATEIIVLQNRIVDCLMDSNTPLTASEVAMRLNAAKATVGELLHHLRLSDKDVFSLSRGSTETTRYHAERRSSHLRIRKTEC